MPGTLTLIGEASGPSGPWQPVKGQGIDQLLQAKFGSDDEVMAKVAAASSSILGRCVDPKGKSDCWDTGLVIGYVQSGKTLSFTAVGAMARDNGYPIVIVIAGTSRPLFGQSEARLLKDLEISTGSARRWAHLSNPSTRDRGALESVISGWADPKTPSSMRRSALITVMKHHGRLASLATLLASVDLQGVPALVVDDEADQASMNNNVNRSGEASPTYRRIAEVRSQLPRHTFLQYTATPQAPLLINIIDELSPNFVEVIEPGEGYVGGKELFIDSIGSHVETIPDNEIPTKDEPLEGPPDSLLRALQIFLVGAACGFIKDEGHGNRSMLIHPSRLVADHAEYYRWVQRSMELWKETLADEGYSADRDKLVASFREAYENIATTVDDLPSFEEVLRYLVPTIRNTLPIEVNKGTKEVPWHNAYPWILVGGQALDRGFTIEGLTVTYMPRGPGTRQADTIQQRGRFFGYKKGYVGYVRLWLEEDVRDAFRSYVEHEEMIRADLVNHARTGEPLDRWRRRFIMDPSLRPTRASVIDLDLIRGRFSDKWFQTTVPALSRAKDNRTVIDELESKLSFEPDEGHPDRSETQRHRVAEGVPLRDVLPLLVQFEHSDPGDRYSYTGLLVQLSAALEHDRDLSCSVYLMGPEKSRRQRGINTSGEVTNLFQGAYPEDKAKRGSVYKGDAYVRSSEHVSVQLHRLDLTSGRGTAVVKGGEDVPAIAVWVPRSLARGYVVQEETI